ncbi:Phosphatase PAP2 family protein [Rhodovastum atsumiense]|nr:phosphatase PAP2 family protein [Rhodovastum atsumiense]CAH2604687.1 Phosphatase PAP2 family protein [Rhodovastum atsumiense]
MALLDRFDLAILGLLAACVGENQQFHAAMLALAQCDFAQGIFLVMLFWFAWWHTSPQEPPARQEERRQTLSLVLLTSLVVVLLSRALQSVLAVHRHPPGLEAGQIAHLRDAMELGPWGSFPSSHAILFFSLAVGLCWVNRRVGLLALAWCAGMIEFPRLYLGQHYPSDVMAGAVFGIGCMLAVLSLPLEQTRARLDLWRTRHPGSFYAGAFWITCEFAHLFSQSRNAAGLAFNLLAPH